MAPLKKDPVTRLQDSLLDSMERWGSVPKIMFTKTSAEYWPGDAVLNHIGLETLTDAAESLPVRRYHFTDCQHGRREFLSNSVDLQFLLWPALDDLDRWVATGEEPPASRHPSLDDGTAVESHTLLERFAQLSGVRIPPRHPGNRKTPRWILASEVNGNCRKGQCRVARRTAPRSLAAAAKKKARITSGWPACIRPAISPLGLRLPSDHFRGTDTPFAWTRAV